MTKISASAEQSFSPRYNEPYILVGAGEDIKIVNQNMYEKDTDKHHPTKNGETIRKDAQQMACIFISNQAAAVPTLAHRIKETIDEPRLVNFFIRQITSESQNIIAVKGKTTGNVYGFIWIGAPMQKELKEIIGEDAAVLHGLYVDRNYHGDRLAHMLWKDFLEQNQYGEGAPHITTLYTVVSKANTASQDAFKKIGAQKYKNATTGQAYNYEVKTFSGEYDPSHIIRWTSFELIRTAANSAFGISREEILQEATGGDALPYTPPPEQYR